MQDLFDFIQRSESIGWPFVIFFAFFALFIALFHTVIFSSLWEVKRIPTWFFFVVDPALIFIAAAFDTKYSLAALLALLVSLFLSAILGMIARGVLDFRDKIKESNQESIEEGKGPLPKWKILLSILVVVTLFGIILMGQIALFVFLIFIFIPIMSSVFFPSAKKKFYRYQKMLPTSKIASLAMGLVEIRGELRMQEKMIAPIGDKECIGYRYTEEEIKVDDEGRTSYSTVLDKTECQPFSIEDESGVLAVNPSKIEIIDFEESDQFEEYRMRYTQYLLRPGQKVMMIGDASLEENKTVIKHDEAHKILAVVPTQKVHHYNLFKPLLNRFITYNLVFVALAALTLLSRVDIKAERVFVDFNSAWENFKNLF